MTFCETAFQGFNEVSMELQWSVLLRCIGEFEDPITEAQKTSSRVRFLEELGSIGELNFTLNGTYGICMDRMQPLDNWQ